MSLLTFLLLCATGHAALTANAGVDQAISLPTQTVTLSGSGSGGGTITAYAWVETSSVGATITSPTSASTTVTNLVAGVYTFQLTVTDNLSATATDTVQITVSASSLVTGCASKKVVVLGSSTAAGQGASPSNQAWATRYGAYLATINGSSTVSNLAVGGYTSYELMPTGSTPPGGRPSPVTTNNITAALALSPAAIILGLVSNDFSAGYSVAEVEANYQTITDAAAAAGVSIWVQTGWAAAALGSTNRAHLVTFNAWVLSTYARSLNPVPLVADGNLDVLAQYSAGDSVPHLNNAGHEVLLAVVEGAGLIETLCAAPQSSFAGGVRLQGGALLK